MAIFKLHNHRSNISKYALIATLVLALFSSITGELRASSQQGVSLEGSYLAGREASFSRDNVFAAEYFLQALEEDPENKIILDKTLELLIKSGSFAQAKDIAERLHKLEPGHAKSANLLALTAINNGAFDRALNLLKKSEEFPIGSLSSALLRAWAYAGKKDNKKAVAVLDELKSHDNFTTFRMFHTALIQDFMGNKEEASRLYKEARKESQQFIRLVQAYGAFLEARGEKDNAIRLYESFLKNNPDDAIISHALKNVTKNKLNAPLISSVKLGASEAMLNISRAILHDSSTIDLSTVYLRFSLYLNKRNDIAQHQLGEIYELVDNYEKAITAYEAVESSSPLYTNAVIEIAENLNRLEKRFRARLKLKLHIFKDSKDIKPVYVLGNLLRNQERYKDAGKIYSRALRMIEKVERHHWRIFYYRGISYERIKLWDLAEKDFKEALKLMPDQPDVLNYLGYSWVEQRKNLDEAMDMIKRANKFKPNDGYIIDSLGWAYYKLGKYEKAVTYLENAVQFKPEDPIINDHLGDAYWKVGRKLEAGFQWNHAKFQLQLRLGEKETESDTELLESVEKKIEEKSVPHARSLRLKKQAENKNPL